MNPSWQGELRLGFLDPDRITFFRHPDDQMPGLTLGRRYAVVLVEIQNDETASPRGDQPEDGPTPTRTVRCSNRAAMLCKDERFQGWVRWNAPSNWSFKSGPNSGEMLAREYLLLRCKIDSRAQLDTDKWAAMDFNRIEVEFYTWVQHQERDRAYQKLHAGTSGRRSQADPVGEVRGIREDAAVRESPVRKAGPE
jgi:hypothetical protein